MNNTDVKRILYCIPETAGDCFISTGVLDSLQKKFPNAKIYVATQPQYANILEGNPNVAQIIEFHDSMLNYRAWETWGPQKNLFDMVFCPFIVTQRIPHWIHQGFGEYLGDVYAHLCDVEYGEQFMNVDLTKIPTNQPYITVHSQTRQDPKDYDKMQQVLDKIINIKKVQIGGSNDKKLDGIDYDLRGKTSPQQLAGVLSGAKLHFGLDSFPMHIALYVGTPCIILFGGTYAKQGVNPAQAHLIHAVETQQRGFCVTSCHLIECIAKQRGFDKCINNISVNTVVGKVREVLGEEYTEPPTPIKISSYIIIKDGIKYGFPFESCIEAASKVSDEVVVVDGGSTDGTWEKLQTIKNIKTYQHPWSLDNPSLFGDEKQYARSLCTGTHLIQLDADEIISEPRPGMIRELIQGNADTDILDLPCINFYGNTQTIRVEPNCWKWRISRNDPNIIHGAHGAARQFDAETMKITVDKKVSDFCEYIYADSLNIADHRILFTPELMRQHEMVKQGQEVEQYLECLKKVIASSPCVFHYSWLDLDRKKNNGAFWDETYYGKKKATHNTTEDIENRINTKTDILLKVDFEHPLKEQ